ncbi:MAG: hydrolase [Actinobacteria bacterium]|nr:hydrolase [Actinomycetota bacterium]
MITRPERIVDAHVHLWDPARTDWYPYLGGSVELDLGDTAGMARRFDLPTYRAESTGWNVTGLVNVAAATGPHSIAETLELDRRAEADGQPAAIVGGYVPTATVAEIIEQIDTQLAAPRFRGVRLMGRTDRPVPDEAVLGALRDRQLILELMAHSHQLTDAACDLAPVDDLSVVVEHTGWPTSATDDEFARWSDGLRALADLGDRVTCKLSGLAMPLGSMSPGSLAPWIEFAIETFGPDRCMFASNFPVDGLHGTLQELFTSYATICHGLPADQIDALFAATAERVYRC